MWPDELTPTVRYLGSLCTLPDEVISAVETEIKLRVTSSVPAALAGALAHEPQIQTVVVWAPRDASAK